MLGNERRRGFFKIAGAAGLEPAACGFGDRHSNQLSYAPKTVLSCGL